MNTRLSLLAALLALQIVIVFFVWVGIGDDDVQSTLLEFDTNQVTQLSISGSDNEVDVTKVGSNWMIGDQPADTSMVTTMLKKLAKLDAPWPVASSSSSAQRFEVGDDNFQRRIQLQANGNDLAALYLGSSPGFGRVHGRREGRDDVFSIELSNFELPVDVDGWLDKGLLALSDMPDSVTLTAAPGNQEVRDVSLQATDEGWLINGARADQDAVAAYVKRFGTLQVLGVASDQSDKSPLVPLATLQVSVAGAQHEFNILQAPPDDGAAENAQGDYVIRNGSASSGYRVAAYIAEQLLMSDAQMAEI